MLNIRPGQILISAAALQDANFCKVVICLTEYNERGAMGFIINEIHPRLFNELVEFKQSKPLTLYHGGPMENESLYVLHCRPDLIQQSDFIAPNLYLGGDFKQTIHGINAGKISTGEIKFFIGYCGWDAGQLEAEIAEGSWRLVPDTSEIVFTTATTTLWELLYQQSIA